MRFAEQSRNPRLTPIIRRLAAPLRVAVRGRAGVGRTTVVAALTSAGVTVSPDDDAADVDVVVIAESLKPEDRLSIGRREALLVLNKADLTGFGPGGPLASAHRRAAECRARTGVPAVPMVALLATAELDDEMIGALRVLVHEPADLSSTDAFVQCDHRLSQGVRRRLLAALDRFGIAHAVLAGADVSALPALLRQLSLVDRVVEHLDAVGAPVRYRRTRSAIGELHALAAQSGDQQLAEFLSADDTVLADDGGGGRRCRSRRRARRQGRPPRGAFAQSGVLAAVWPRSGRRTASKLFGRYLSGLAATARAVTMTADARSGDVTDPIAEADALVTAIDPGVRSPGVLSSDAILVTGPWLAGTTSLIAALRDRMPEHTFVEADELGPADAPAAVVFVVSAVTPVSESDCALIDLATNYTDLVVGVVSKIDAHRNWRDVLATNRSLLTERAPHYTRVQWVGAAAAPDLGEPRLDELVGVLRQRLSDPDTARRNRLRAWESRLARVIGRHQSDGGGVDRRARVTALRQNREDILRARHVAKTERGIALRSQIQQARVQLGYSARNRSTSVRSELAEDAAQRSRRRLGTFECDVRTRFGEIADEVDEGITEHVGAVAAELGLPAPPLPAPPPQPQIPAPPLKSRRLETQLMMILGAGFGLGVALAVTRLFAGLEPGLTVAGLATGGLVGLLLTVWVVGIRGLLHDRAVLDRWVSDITHTLRSAVEERVATRVLVAETALTSELRARDQIESNAAADRIAEIDAELREHAIQTARAAAVRDRRLPPLQQALDKVRVELYGSPDLGTGGRVAIGAVQP